MNEHELEQTMWKLDDKLKKLSTRRADVEGRYLEAVAKPKLRELIGKCFKYRNSYSSGDSWWLYTRIISLNESTMSFKTVEFQKTSCNRIEIRVESIWNFKGRTRLGVENGWVPISLEEYKREAKSTQRLIARLLEQDPK